MTIFDPGIVTPEIEIPTVADIVKPKKMRCRAVKNRRGEWRVRGRDCKKLKPSKKISDIRFDLEECVVEIDRLGNRYMIGDDCPNEPVEIPEPEVPENFGDRCPEDYFPPSQFIDEVKFAMPVHDEYGFPFPHPILPEPFVIHRDHEAGAGANKLDCESYDGWHLCYDSHGGADFMLAGHFLAMDNANVSVRAAAAGRVMRVVDGNFDRCRADIDPTSPTFGDVICPNPDADNTSLNPTNRVSICHPDGTISSYLHLMNGTIDVFEGQSVFCGQPLALIGSSGNSSAPHLHFHVRKKNEDGGHDSVDPYAVNDEDSMWVDQNGGLPGTLPSTQCQS